MQVHAYKRRHSFQHPHRRYSYRQEDNYRKASEKRKKNYIVTNYYCKCVHAAHQPLWADARKRAGHAWVSMQGSVTVPFASPSVSGSRRSASYCQLGNCDVLATRIRKLNRLEISAPWQDIIVTLTSVIALAGRITSFYQETICGFVYFWNCSARCHDNRYTKTFPRRGGARFEVGKQISTGGLLSVEVDSSWSREAS